MESHPQRTETTLLLPCDNKRKRNILGENDKRRKNMVGDHISQLSDDILVNILSRLTMKEAVRTSILSIRWKYLWKGFTGCLNFDDPLTMADLKYVLYLNSDAVDVERNKFVNWVNQVLSSFQCRCIEELRICFHVVSNGDIDNWIKFALERRVERLELNFDRADYNSWSVGEYIFPSHLDFHSLTSLSLTMVSITGEVIEHLLSYCCPLLEVLSVAHLVTLTNLKVSGPSLKLKHLKLKFVHRLKDLELHAPNLLSFEYIGPVVPVSFENVPNLVEASFHGRLSTYIVENLSEHSSFLVHLHTLKLDIISSLYFYEAGRYCNNIPEFCNLKHLEIIGEPKVNHLLFCVALLKVSPSLYKFTLKLVLHPSEYESVKTIKDHPFLSFKELRIRVVELQGFVGLTAEVEFLMYLIESAKLLEKIIINPCSPFFVGTPIELISREEERFQSGRRRAIDLAAKFPLWEFEIP